MSTTSNTTIAGTSVTFTRSPYSFIVQGGFVTSKNDGQRHYVSPQKLIRLYGVDPRQCKILPDKTGCRMEPGQVFLMPKANGDYRILPPPTYPITSQTFATGTTYTANVSFYRPPAKTKKEKKVSQTYPYKCGQCLREAKWTMIGITRHWRKCVRNHDDG